MIEVNIDCSNCTYDEKKREDCDNGSVHVGRACRWLLNVFIGRCFVMIVIVMVNFVLVDIRIIGWPFVCAGFDFGGRFDGWNGGS